MSEPVGNVDNEKKIELDNEQKVEFTTKEKAEYQQIERDMSKLGESMAILRKMVIQQQPAIDSIEEFIAESKNQTRQAKLAIIHAEEYHSNTNYMYMMGGVVALITYLFL